MRLKPRVITALYSHIQYIRTYSIHVSFVAALLKTEKPRPVEPYVQLMHVSDAVCVIAVIIPICLLMEEDSECYRDRNTSGVRKRMRASILLKWQQ